MQLNRLMAFTSATALTSLFFNFTAIAQQTSPSVGFSIEEIVVTARMRAENLQDIPLSETAFTAKMIEDARINQMGDFIALTPNITMTESQNVGNTFITVRGVTQVRNGETPVAIVVDGVLQVNPNQFNQELFDVQQIEVLRGPQGALYGRNATGGAILITTKQPTNELEGNIKAGLGKGDEWQVQGSISGPIVEDKLLFRASARYYTRDGYFNNTTTGKKVDPFEDVSVRGLIKWNVTENFTVDLRANISRAEGGALNYTFQPVNLLPNGAIDMSNPFDFSRQDADLVTRTFTANNVGYNERDIDEFSVKLDYDAGFATFTSISSYTKLTEYSEGDQFPYTAAAFSGFGLDGTQTQFIDVKAWSQEFRIASHADQRFRWMIGAYYLKTDRFISSTTGNDLGLGITRIERAPSLLDPINPTATFLADDNNNKAWAMFGNISYDITDQLEASAAIRYDKDKREQLVSPLQISGIPGVGTPGAINHVSFDKWQPKFSLRYKATDDVSVYGSWGKGFRSGQFNQNGVAGLAAGAGLLGVTNLAGDEGTTTWEGGIKTEWLDRRVRVNAALFHTKVTGQHYFVFVGAVGAQILVNIDEVELIGGEIEAVANLADGFDVFGSVGVTDSKVKAYAINPAAVGNKSPYVPAYTLNLGAQYRVPVTTELGLLARVDYERRGKQYWDPENSTARSTIDLVNVRFGIEDNDGRWSLIGTVKNLTDEKYNSEFVAGGFAHAGLPRTWHVEAKYNF